MELELKAFHVPKGIEFTSFYERTYSSKGSQLILQMPKLTGGHIKEIAEKVKGQQENYLSKLKIGEIVEKIDASIQKWLQPDYYWRQVAEEWLPVITGYDAEMIRLELKRFLRTFRKKDLLRFLDEEFDQAAVLDEFRPRKNGGLSRVYGPNGIFHLFSGNVPALPIWSIVMGLLVKSGAIGKTSSSEPLMAVLFAYSLAEVDPDLADSLAVLPWKGGTEELEEAAIGASEAIIVYGSGDVVNQVRAKVTGSKRFISYGQKISFAMVGREALTADKYRETAHLAAEDVSLFDQQGCLSAHSIFVEEGGAVSPKQFAQHLASEMRRYHEKRPRSELTEAESAAIHSVRNQAEFEAMNGAEMAVYASKVGTDWTVIYNGETGFSASPLNRTVHVFRCERLEAAIPFLSAYREYLQTAGLAVGPERLQVLAEWLGRAGVNRLCAIGQTARTPAGWHHDGRFNLLDLVRWTDIERNAEEQAEQYDSDVE